MLKAVLIVLVVMAVLAAGGMAWAKHRGYCSVEDRMHYVTEKLGRKLDLNDRQKSHLQVFTAQLRELRGERHEARDIMKDRVGELLSAPSLDREQAVALLGERHRAMSENRRTLVDAFADFSDSLAPEQRSKLAELISDRMGHRWGPPHWSH